MERPICAIPSHVYESPFLPPADMDPECIDLCIELNKLPGVRTISSCSGHGEFPFDVYIAVQKLEDLWAITYCMNVKIIGHHGWLLEAFATPFQSYPLIGFKLIGPAGDNEGVAKIVEELRAGYWREPLR